MNDKITRMKRVRSIRTYRNKRKLDFIYFLAFALIFYGFTQWITPPIKSSINYVDKAVTSLFRPSSKAYAQIIWPVPSNTPINREYKIINHSATWEEFKASARKIAKIYNYPAKVLIAQAALESKRGTSQYAVERNNYFGMNAIDSDPDQAYWYENAEQSIIDYIITIRSGYGAAWNKRTSPEDMLVEIKNGGYATDPAYVAKVESMIEWWQE